MQLSFCLRLGAPETDSGVEICGQEASWGSTLRNKPLYRSEGDGIGQRETLNCDEAATEGSPVPGELGNWVGPSVRSHIELGRCPPPLAWPSEAGFLQGGAVSLGGGQAQSDSTASRQRAPSLRLGNRGVSPGGGGLAEQLSIL